MSTTENTITLHEDFDNGKLVCLRFANLPEENDYLDADSYLRSRRPDLVKFMDAASIYWEGSTLVWEDPNRDL